MKFFLYDETMMNTKAKITTEKLSAMSDIVSQKAQYITAAGAATPNQITIAAGVLIAVGSSVFKTVLTNLTTANLDTGSGFEMETDIFFLTLLRQQMEHHRHQNRVKRDIADPAI